MRSKIIKRFAAGTCSVCMMYALTAEAVRGLIFPTDDIVTTEETVQLTTTVTEMVDTEETTVTETIVTETTATTSSSNDEGSWPYADQAETRSGGKDRDRSNDSQGPDRTTSYAQVTETAASETVQSTASTTDEDNQTTVAASDNDEETTTVTSQTDTDDTPPTLSQYLSALRCSGCRHNCLLVSPRCMKGKTKAKNATEEYYELYGS